MKKYAVWAKVGASVKIGEYEAESEEKAVEMAEEDKNANWIPSLCHHCAEEIEIGDAYDPYAQDID